MAAAPGPRQASCYGGKLVPSASRQPHAALGGLGSGPRYKWIALSNTTLGMLMATINSSIMLIALPDIFRGIGVNPLQPGNTSRARTRTSRASDQDQQGQDQQGQASGDDDLEGGQGGVLRVGDPAAVRRHLAQRR